MTKHQTRNGDIARSGQRPIRRLKFGASLDVGAWCLVLFLVTNVFAQSYLPRRANGAPGKVASEAAGRGVYAASTFVHPACPLCANAF